MSCFLHIFGKKERSWSNLEHPVRSKFYKNSVVLIPRTTNIYNCYLIRQPHKSYNFMQSLFVVLKKYCDYGLWVHLEVGVCSVSKPDRNWNNQKPIVKFHRTKDRTDVREPVPVRFRVSNRWPKTCWTCVLEPFSCLKPEIAKTEGDVSV